jgi:hypothetical protein
MRTVTAAGLALILASLGGEALAGTPYPQKMTCPVGGEPFVFTATMSYSTWGARPDGKPYGSWEFPAPVPECPGNRLVVFTQFTKDQVKQLEPLLASPEYKALAGETTYYRMLWLAKALKIPNVSDAWLLQQASWQTDGDPERKARYQREFVAAVDADPVKLGDVSWFSDQVGAVNAERELGQFDAATARIARLRDGLSKPFPVPVKADSDAEAGDPEVARKNLLVFLDKQALVIGHKDAGSEPLELITPRIAARRCLDLVDANQAIPDACKSADLQALIDKERAFKKTVDAPPKS